MSAGGHSAHLESGTVELWLSSYVIPAGGGTLAAALRGEWSDSPVYGPVYGLHVWDGSTWLPFGSFMGCGRPYPECAPDLRPPGEVWAVALIGYSVGRSGYGGTTYFALAALDPGWYRIRRSGEPDVAAVVQVMDEEFVLVDLESVPVASGLDRPVVPTDGGLLRTREQRLPGRDARQWLRSERWTDGRWQDAFDVEAVLVPPEVYWPQDVEIRIPATPEGAFRIWMWDPNEEREAAAHFWIRSDAESTD